MGSFRYNGAISGSILNTPLGMRDFTNITGRLPLLAMVGMALGLSQPPPIRQPPWPTAPQFLPMRHRKISPLAGGRSQFKIEI